MSECFDSWHGASDDAEHHPCFCEEKTPAKLAIILQHMINEERTVAKRNISTTSFVFPSD